ncbi:MAG: protein-L-isoaspartate(D-aspartate) O-methyltransferase [Candidatus Omnitrophica bacterium]|nr:protein-L-isoaspartate(D-aspartate) O-methyltransferase [Candidatus Omnitrophota bacterium]MCM8831004.1 protein-L-isoaspartate(D-aspartate) O-methyltransferase [Candidatus Omnitrophota bacterium]
MKEDFNMLKEKMIKEQIFSRGIKDQRILDAFRKVPRHLFVPESQIRFSYIDSPLPIGEGQTISQPYIVALMTLLLDVKESQKVLEIGTGSGYQAAILAYLGAKVYSIERIASLAEKAKTLLSKLGYDVQIKIGDGSLGWEEYSPYDRIIVTAASPSILDTWRKQLKIGGKMVLPVEYGLYQMLVVVNKISETEFSQKQICECIFVPLVGKYGYKE